MDSFISSTRRLSKRLVNWLRLRKRIDNRPENLLHNFHLKTTEKHESDSWGEERKKRQSPIMTQTTIGFNYFILKHQGIKWNFIVYFYTGFVAAQCCWQAENVASFQNEKDIKWEIYARLESNCLSRSPKWCQRAISDSLRISCEIIPHNDVAKCFQRRRPDKPIDVETYFFRHNVILLM